MGSPTEQVTAPAPALPAKERAELVDQLVESLDPLQDDALRSRWATEAVRRRDEVRAGVVQTVPEGTAAERVRRLLAR